MNGKRSERMRLRTPEEQRAYLDGFEMCANGIKKYLSDRGKKILECQLTAVRNAVNCDDFEDKEK